MYLNHTDWFFIVCYILLVVYLGIFLSKKSIHSISDFFTANKEMPWWLSGISMVATTFAADTPLAVTGIVILSGVSGNWVWWGFILSGLFTTFLFAKLWHRSGVKTDTELIEIRYSGQAASFLRGFRALYLAIPINCIILGWVTSAMAKIISATTGQDPWQIIIFLYVLTTIYIAVSGIRGVIFTDFVQFFIALAGSFIIMYYAINHESVGSLKNLVSQLHSNNQSDYLSMLPAFIDGAKFTLLLFCVYSSVIWWSTWYPGAEPGGGGYVAQRMFSTKTDKDAMKASLLFNICHYALRPWPWIITALSILFIYPEIGMKAEYDGVFVQVKDKEQDLTKFHIEYNQVNINGDTLRVKDENDDTLRVMIANQDLLTVKKANFKKDDNIYDINKSYAVFMKNAVPAGLKGIIIIAFLSAFMSTVSTQINWGSSYIVNDFYARFIRKEKEFDSSEGASKHYVRIARLTTILIMFLSMISSYYINSIEGAWKFLISIGAGTGLVYMLRWYWWRINAYSEISAMIAALIGYIISINMFNSYSPQDKEAYTILFTTLFTTITWVVVTLITPSEPKELLEDFYNKVKPFGSGWKKISNNYYGSIYPSLINVCLGLITIHGFLFGVGKILFQETLLGYSMLVVAVFAMVLLIKRINYSEKF